MGAVLSRTARMLGCPGLDNAGHKEHNAVYVHS
jgi:hypothetical protein